MNEILILLIAISAGVLMGIFFYGGLRLTVKKSTAAGSPALLFLGSFVLRTAVVVTGFYLFIAHSSPGAWLACMAAFVIARIVITRQNVYKENKVMVKKN